jgi:hypothetical protein
MPWRNHLSLFGAFTTMLYVSISKTSQSDINNYDYFIVQRPTQEFYDRMVIESSRSCWPHISRINAHCNVELTLDEYVIVHRLIKLAYIALLIVYVDVCKS